MDTDHVYWTNYIENGQVMSCPKSGCNGSPTTISSGEASPYAIVVTPDTLYWTTLDNSATRCFFLPGDGGAPSSPNAAGDGPSYTLGFANGTLYYGGSKSIGASSQWNGCTTSSSAANAANQMSPRSIVLQGGIGYWIANGNITSCNFTQGSCGDPNPAPVVAANQPKAQAVAVDSFNAYWTNDDGTILSVPLGSTGSAPTTVTSGLVHPYAIAVQNDQVYFTTFGTGAGDGEVAKVAKSGGAPTVIAGQRKRPFALALDAQYLYWTDTDEGTVNRASL